MMIKKLGSLITSKSGFSLIEVLASIVLLALIVGPFLTMFVQSAQTNQDTQNIDEATFVANGQMEELYHLSQTIPQSQLPTSIGTDYQPYNCNGEGCYTKQVTNHFIFIQLTPVQNQAPLENVLVKVYKTSSMNQLQAQMETVYSWKN